MIAKDVLLEVLAQGLSCGGDFSEIFVEDKTINSIRMMNGKIEDVISGRDYGAGIRIMKGYKCVYAYTNDTDKTALLDIVKKAACALNDMENREDQKNIFIVEKIPCNAHQILYVPSSLDNCKKVVVVRDAYKTAKNYSPEIVQVSVIYGDVDQKILIANSEGLLVEDRRVRTRLCIQSVASNGTENQTGFEGPGRYMGFEMFEAIDSEHYAKEASRSAVTMLHADLCPGGRMPAVIESGFGGVIFHEACGHALEATSVAKEQSVFTGKIGMKIASEKVTAIDDGTIPNAWGSINVDDEGVQSQKKVLIENGVLKTYMVDKLNGRRMETKPNGSSRRQSYKYAPTSRMTNTYIAAGNDEDNDIIASVPEGLYAKKMGGGSVNPITGEFNFAVAEGYIIKNGKIDKPVRGATLIGKGSDIILKIDMVGKNVEMGQGMCGSLSGSIPVNVGQPMIRVSEITVGGR